MYILKVGLEANLLSPKELGRVGWWQWFCGLCLFMRGVAVASESAVQVRADRTTLTAWNLREDGTGYAVQLRGKLDRTFYRAFCLMHVKHPRHNRFQLDPDKGIVWFACRAGDAPASIVPVLDSLDQLIRATNERVLAPIDSASDPVQVAAGLSPGR